jgi:hypothetical protein
VPARSALCSHQGMHAPGRDVLCIQIPPARSCVCYRRTPLKAWNQQEWSPGTGDPARSGPSTSSTEAQGSGGAMGWTIQGPAWKNNTSLWGGRRSSGVPRKRGCLSEEPHDEDETVRPTTKQPANRTATHRARRPRRHSNLPAGLSCTIRVVAAEPQRPNDNQSSVGESRHVCGCRVAQTSGSSCARAGDMTRRGRCAPMLLLVVVVAVP